MKAFKYTVIDMKRSKMQIGSMLLFGMLGYFFAQGTGIIMGLSYIIFATIIMQGATFTLEEKSETGFINLLPGSDRERVAGRFFMGIIYIIIGIVMGIVMSVIIYFQDEADLQYMPQILIAFTGGALVFISIQNIAFFAIGKHNSRQLMSLIHMIPGIILFGVMSGVAAIIETSSAGNGMEVVYKLILWIQDYSVAVSMMVFLLGVIATIAGICFSEKIISKKDYA